MISDELHTQEKQAAEMQMKGSMFRIVEQLSLPDPSERELALSTIKLIESFLVFSDGFDVFLSQEELSRLTDHITESASPLVSEEHINGLSELGSFVHKLIDEAEQDESREKISIPFTGGNMRLYIEGYEKGEHSFYLYHNRSGHLEEAAETFNKIANDLPRF